MTTTPFVWGAPTPRHSDTGHALQAVAFFLLAILSLPFYVTAKAACAAWDFCRDSPRLRRIGRSLVFSLAATAAIGGLAIRLVFFGGAYPDLGSFLEDSPPTIGRIEDARGESLAELAVQYRRPFDDHDLPPVVRRALLAAEDRNFFEHGGVDLTALPRIVAKAAAASYHSHRLTLPQGGSTITMQLARIVFLREWTAAENGPTPLRDGWLDRLMRAAVGVPNANKLRRKIEEIRLALWLEGALERRLGSRELAKREILRRYATDVYLGEGRYGFAAAAEHYFGRRLASFDGRDAGAAALLAGIPKWPGRYAPTEANRERALRRRNHVLGLMAYHGFLTEDERRRYQALPVPVAGPSGPNLEAVRAPAAVHTILGTMKDAGDSRVSVMALLEGRIRVESTVDGRIQDLLKTSLEEGLKLYEARHPASRGVIQGSAVVLANADARILAIAGGRQVFQQKPTTYSDLNRVTDSRRQPGSAMKPVVYLAAFRRGADLDTQVLDGPIAVPMGRGRPMKWITNYDGTFRGPIPMRRALAESRNAAAVRLVTGMGVGAVIKTAHELGIRSELQPYVTTALGASEVTLLELANMYRTLASRVSAEPWIVRRVTTSGGMELFRHSDAPLRELDDPALPKIQEALRGVVRLPGGTAHSLASLPVPVMGKTGTTNDFRDALFVGSTFGPSGITIAVRIGFDDNRSLGHGETGGRVALPVFRKLIEGVYRDGFVGPPPAFPPAMEQDIDAYLHVGEPAPEPLVVRASNDAAPAAGADPEPDAESDLGARATLAVVADVPPVQVAGGPALPGAAIQDGKAASPGQVKR